MRFDFAPGRILARKYQVLAPLGLRPGGELYTLSERATGIERTARFYYPANDPENRIVTSCAQKLHKLRHCDILMQYRTQETISVNGDDVTFLVSDRLRGEPLADFLADQPGRRLPWFSAMHLLHALAQGLEAVHKAGEYHGELSVENVMIRRQGLGFKVKLLDLTPLPSASKHAIQDDVYDMLRIFHEAIGGAKVYPTLPAEVRAFCMGMRRPQIEAKFRHAGELRRHLEIMTWD